MTKKENEPVQMKKQVNKIRNIDLKEKITNIKNSLKSKTITLQKVQDKLKDR